MFGTRLLLILSAAAITMVTAVTARVDKITTESDSDSDDDEVTTTKKLSNNVARCVAPPPTVPSGPVASSTFTLPLPEYVNCNITEPKISPYCRFKSKCLKIERYKTLHFYLPSKDPVNWREANQECRKRGLELLTFPKLQQKLDLFAEYIMTTAAAAATNSSSSKAAGWWIGVSSRKSSFSTRLGAVREKYSFLPPDALTCYQLTVSKGGRWSVSEEECDEDKSLVCELPPQCALERCFPHPPVFNKPNQMCRKDACPDLSVGKAGRAKAIDKKSISAAIASLSKTSVWRNICNQTFLFIPNVGSFTESMRSCASLGMRLLSVETQDKLNCVLAAMRRDNYTFPNNATYAFYTSGFDDFCDSVYYWCSTRARLGAQTPWLPGAPYSASNVGAGPAELCTALFVSATQSGLVSALCSLPKVYICEGELTTPTNNEESPGPFSLIRTNKTPPPRAFCAKCPRSCDLVAEEEKFYSKSKKGNPNKGPEITKGKNNKTVQVRNEVPDISYGENCGYKFAFLEARRAFELSNDECCALNMTIALIDTQEKLQCIHQSYKAASLDGPRMYWTDAVFCNGEIKSCLTSARLSYMNLPWFPNEPKLMEGLSGCAVLHLAHTQAVGLFDVPCLMVQQVICEAPLSKPATTEKIPTITSTTTAAPKTERSEKKNIEVANDFFS